MRFWVIKAGEPIPFLTAERKDRLWRAGLEVLSTGVNASSSVPALHSLPVMLGSTQPLAPAPRRALQLSERSPDACAPSCIFVIRASSSCGCFHSSLDPFLGRSLSTFAKSSRVGVSMPDACATCLRNSWRGWRWRFRGRRPRLAGAAVSRVSDRASPGTRAALRRRTRAFRRRRRGRR